MPRPLHRVASHDWQPNVVCGIDFGMTCTGVSYVELEYKHTNSVPHLRNMQRWLGIHNSRLEDKVPTELCYDDNGTVVSWGLHCKEQEDRSEVKRHFKLNIAADGPDFLTYGHTTEAARRHFTDYIGKLCGYIDEYLTGHIPHYRAKSVEFVFSIPTAWVSSTDTISQVKTIIRNVVGESQWRRAVVGLTEAEAAAVDVVRSSYEKGNVILVCDSGGGTTDVNIVKLASSSNEPARMKGLTYDEGITIGSTRIDQAATNYICRAMGKASSSDFHKIVVKAVEGKFQDFKHDYGTAASSVPDYYLPIPGMDKYVSLPSQHVEGTKFKIPEKKMKEWFDEQINEIITLVNGQITKFGDEYKKEKIAYVVLTGGFGINQYVQERLRKTLKTTTSSKNSPVMANVQVLSAENPQLAVVRGLVYNRAQELIQRMPVYEEVCCRTSYGIVTQELYHKKDHRGEAPIIHKDDRKRWVHGQVDWVIKQGILIPSTGIVKPYGFQMREGEERQKNLWTCEIVSCGLPRKYLPTNVSHREVRPVCTIKVDVSKLAVEAKRWSAAWLPLPSSSIFSSSSSKDNDKTDKNGKRYIAKFDLLIIVGAADLRFQVHPRGENDTLASEPHEDIEVEWFARERAAGIALPIGEGRQPIAL